MSNLDAKKDEKRVTFGRPRLLTHEEIINAAVEMGLDSLTMKKLATKLNVGTATLYQYYDSRKSLVRAAAVHSLADIALPEDRGQSWPQLAREYAQSIQELLAEQPSFIFSYQQTDYGFEVQFKLIEPFLASMVARGFSAEDAMTLFNTIGMAAFAGAVETVRQQEFEFNDETMETAVKRQFGRLDPLEYPKFSNAIDVFVQSPTEKIDFLLNAAFETIARSRGEILAELIGET